MSDRHEIRVISIERGIMIAQLGEHFMKVYSPSGVVRWNTGLDTDRWFKTIEEAERHHEARSDFLDELAGLFAIAIQHGVTEEELRADFEAQLSLQDFGDEHPENVTITTMRGAVARVWQEVEDSRWDDGDDERLIEIGAQHMTAEGGKITAPWSYTDGMSTDHGTVKANGDGSFTVEFSRHEDDPKDYPYQRFHVNKDGSVDMVVGSEPGPNYNK